ncbi:MAG: hypothetical protein OEZ68_04240 [Gammaproteobacteria bacterium]|nr:hypothetical protein [Gammaproteobacteria bacterium]MDH5799997.1 hypothetical protein [Gammaproteobacteria bacterium]
MMVRHCKQLESMLKRQRKELAEFLDYSLSLEQRALLHRAIMFNVKLMRATEDEARKAKRTP